MRYLIFGCNGFIGSHLVNFLIDQGNQVLGCDIQNESAVLVESAYFPHQDSQDFINSVADNRIDVCINCAGSASVPHSFQNPFKDYELNTRIVFRILSAINHVDKKVKFVNLSSAAIYGNPKSIPIAEDADPRPISPYGNHKFMSELICKQFADYFDVDTCSLRIFSAYGEGLRKQLFWDLYQKTLNDADPVVLWGTGRESRDFIHISDLVNAIYIVANQNKFSQQIYNVGNGKEVFIADAANYFFKAYSSELSYSFSGEERKGDPINWSANISGLKKLGYEPKVNMAEGLQLYAEWLRNV
jgi:UDP-glucose 4-epimerase